MVRALVISGPNAQRQSSWLPHFGTDVEILDPEEGGQAAVEAAIAACPEVVVIDTARRDLEWEVAARQIRSRLPAASIVLVASSVERDMLQRASRTGAHCYVITQGQPREVVEAVSTAAENESQRPLVLNIYVEEPVEPPSAGDHERVRTAGAPPSAKLTARQVDVVRLMAQGKRNADIAAELCISQRTVESHSRAILRRLDAQDRTQAVLAAVKAGIVSPETAGLT